MLCFVHGHLIGRSMVPRRGLANPGKNLNRINSSHATHWMGLYLYFVPNQAAELRRGRQDEVLSVGARSAPRVATERINYDF